MRLYVEVPVLYDKIDPEMEKLDLPNGNPILDTFEVPEIIDLYNIRSIRSMLKSNGKPGKSIIVAFYQGPDIVINMEYSIFKNKFAEKIHIGLL